MDSGWYIYICVVFVISEESRIQKFSILFNSGGLIFESFHLAKIVRRGGGFRRNASWIELRVRVVFGAH